MKVALTVMVPTMQRHQNNLGSSYQSKIFFQLKNMRNQRNKDDLRTEHQRHHRPKPHLFIYPHIQTVYQTQVWYFPSNIKKN